MMLHAYGKEGYCMLKLKCSKSSYNIFQHSQVIVINPLLQKLLRNEYVLKLWIFSQLSHICL